MTLYSQGNQSPVTNATKIQYVFRTTVSLTAKYVLALELLAASGLNDCETLGCDLMCGN